MSQFKIREFKPAGGYGAGHTIFQFFVRTLPSVTWQNAGSVTLETVEEVVSFKDLHKSSRLEEWEVVSP